MILEVLQYDDDSLMLSFKVLYNCNMSIKFCIEIGSIYLCAFVVFLTVDKNQMFV